MELQPLSIESDFWCDNIFDNASCNKNDCIINLDIHNKPFDRSKQIISCNYCTSICNKNYWFSIEKQNKYSSRLLKHNPDKKFIFFCSSICMRIFRLHNN